ncbi:MAG: hypothetical protein WAX03_05790, partial [Trichococcus flocculiformis]
PRSTWLTERSAKQIWLNSGETALIGAGVLAGLLNSGEDPVPRSSGKPTPPASASAPAEASQAVYPHSCATMKKE